MAELLMDHTQSVKARIIERVEARLADIQIINGYQFDVPAVLRGQVDILKLQWPISVIVIPGDDYPDEGATSIVRRELSLVIRVWVKYEMEAPGTLEMIIANVQFAMMRDVRWSDANGEDPLAQNTIEQATQYLYLDDEKPEAGADIAYLIAYRTEATDPTHVL